MEHFKSGGWVNRVENFCDYMNDLITWTISTLELCKYWLF
jgi:hypothetical protein